MEESDFLDEICWAALYTDKHVNFAAVIDSEGKLVVGKSRMTQSQKDLKGKSKTNAEMYPICEQPSYRFYADYLLPTIRKMAGSYFAHQYDDIILTKNNETIHFELVDGNRNGDNVKIVITPLTQSKDKFLCVYFESPFAESYQEIIMKISNMI